MEKKLVNYIKGLLRRAWGRSFQRQSALKSAKVSYGKYKCAKCRKIFRRKNIQVDHIIPVGRFKDFDTYIEKLFVEPIKLQVLCLGCHSIKTKKDIKSFGKK